LLVMYDITDDRRLTRVASIVKDYGERIQKSVFRCVLDDARKKEMVKRLNQELDPDEDQVLIVNLGPPEESEGKRITSLGVRYRVKEEGPTII